MVVVMESRVVLMLLRVARTRGSEGRIVIVKVVMDWVNVVDWVDWGSGLEGDGDEDEAVGRFLSNGGSWSSFGSLD